MHSVMVVDDEPFVRLSIASLADWESEGYDFAFEAANGEVALKLIALEPGIDIVFLDLSMPVMDGLEFLRRLDPRSRRGQSPAVIVLSAHDDFGLVREAFNLGASGYILKSELETGPIRIALAKAEAGLSSSRDGSSAIAGDRNAEALKSLVLRDLLAGPAPDDIEESLACLGLSFSFPLAVIAVWIEDFDAVEQRWKGEGLARHADMLYRSFRQLLSERYRGEVVLLQPSHAVVFLHSESCASFCEDARDYLYRYLSLKASFCVGPACADIAAVPDAYRECCRSRSVESRVVLAAKRAIRERFSDPAFSLEDAASRAGVSPNHLSFEFSKETGETFSSFLSGVRMDEAKRLLASTDLMVYEVAERIGYTSVEHFSRTFKRIVGDTPAHYKASEED